MAALEWFESIQALRGQVAGLDNAIEEAYASAGPKGQQMGSIGGNGGGDSFAGIDRIVDSGMVAERDRLKARLDHMLERATEVLYGKSGRGGLAKAKCSVDADILCCHYLQGMGWADIAREIVRKDTSSPSHWCQMRARRACAYIDRVGMDWLVEF